MSSDWIASTNKVESWRSKVGTHGRASVVQNRTASPHHRITASPNHHLYLALGQAQGPIGMLGSFCEEPRTHEPCVPTAPGSHKYYSLRSWFCSRSAKPKLYSMLRISCFLASLRHNPNKFGFCAHLAQKISFLLSQLSFKLIIFVNQN